MPTNDKIQKLSALTKDKSLSREERKEAAKQLDFLQAAQYRDEIIRLQNQLELK
jgi:excinuclease ABC subunit B